MLCAGNIPSYVNGKKGSRFPAQDPGPVQPGSRPDSKAEAVTVAARGYHIMTYQGAVRSATRALHSIYRTAHVDDSHNGNVRLQILINLRRLGHQIKPAKSW